MATLKEQLATLIDNYSPCDVSDALIKLQKTPEGSTARAGYLADLGKHWVDHVGEFQSSDPSGAGSIVVIEQPENQYCAVTGGIMATRMKALGIKATVVGGRVRDLRELQATGLPIWARATSTVGTNAEAKAGARDVPISIGGVTVSPGDIIFCDPLEGVVAIPRELLGQVLELMPKLTTMDGNAKEAVAQGMSVTDAFKKFR
ncbi:Ribonuclease E inhibitor RraA/Dimethylmenaquinone methyltransferase [Penicillium coprophilum]|uniref:Ribonuclease E inhibitor RraA/Dimethylmenaquinone methyltransferase n=1 Tax=Penicillium coprophilum TaxID=36646 RepID=UPI0023A2396B|nr:Ribonuclease E inhibitor RraA/Dimethylmenaquinone methyltransferase [Penicillium coprophilum]KAJ5169414.1 Ribonuclease E inhibitor RraA/Dimethylmenaquinone methyltransferase [Penicillium coprophilum]